MNNFLLQVMQTGIYAPLTTNGMIVVNDLLASCHSSVVGQQTLHQTFFFWINRVDSWIASISGIQLPEERVDLSRVVQFLLAVIDQLMSQFSIFALLHQPQTNANIPLYQMQISRDRD